MNRSKFEADFERLFEDAVSKSEDNVPIPDADPSWQRMLVKLERERRRVKWLRAARWCGLTAASLMLGTFLFHTLQPTEAFRPMFDMVYKVKGGSVSLNVRSTDRGSTEGAKTAPPPPDDELAPQPLKDNRDLPEENTFRRVQVTIDEAAEKTQFVLPVPQYIPEGYRLSDVTIHYSMGESKASAAKLQYRKETDSTPLSILVRKRSFSAKAELTDGQREVTATTSGIRELEMNKDDINIVVKAELDEKVLNLIADSMKLK
ncbi:hypothetical protein [Paenibacillus sp. UNC451MF]|uniref:hypothetical protein n=1 Tax=Paenibacillus sp. UNC451MF TaxID=1449063 RepID=UPI00048A9BF1|nr:hypothetical protein [Paenibacillus sp. UNC451MF]